MGGAEPLEVRYRVRGWGWVSHVLDRFDGSCAVERVTVKPGCVPPLVDVALRAGRARVPVGAEEPLPDEEGVRTPVSDELDLDRGASVPGDQAVRAVVVVGPQAGRVVDLGSVAEGGDVEHGAGPAARAEVDLDWGLLDRGLGGLRPQGILLDVREYLVGPAEGLVLPDGG